MKGTRWVNRYLIVVAAGGSDESKLVGSILVKDERRESAQARSLIIDHSRHRSFESQVSAVSRQAAVIGEALGVVAKADLLIRVVKTAVSGDDLGLAITLEA